MIREYSKDHSDIGFTSQTAYYVVILCTIQYVKDEARGCLKADMYILNTVTHLIPLISTTMAAVIQTNLQSGIYKVGRNHSRLIRCI